MSLIGSAEPSSGHIVQDEPDRLLIGAFSHPSIDVQAADARAKEFVNIYSAGQKTQCTHSPNVLHDRWRKLVYNACLNPICAITGLDTGRIRLADGALDGLVRPAMREIVQAAKAAAGVELADDVVDTMINVDPLESYLKPSMQQDLEKVRSLPIFSPVRAMVCRNQADTNTFNRATLSNLRTYWVSHLERGSKPVLRCQHLPCYISLRGQCSGG